MAQVVPWSPSDTIALVALVIAVILPLVTIWLSGRQQRQTREDENREHRRREAALVLGPVLGLLVDADPDRLAFNARPQQTEDRLRELRHRFESDIRPGLMAIAAGFTSARQRDLAQRLAVALHNCLGSGGWFAVSLVTEGAVHGDPAEMRQTARADHDEASKLADELAAAIRTGE